MGKSFLYFAGIFAELERDSLITQVKGGMEQKAREGQWNGGRPPLGYDLVDKKLKINKEEEKIVKLIFKEYLGGSGYLAIVDALKEEGYKTKRGNDFSGNAVKDILRNPTYKGWVRWGYRKDWGKKDGNGRRKRKYNENPIYVKGIHKHIIKPEVFDQVQGLIKKNPRSHMRRFQGFHLLSGLLKCPICGQGMSVQNVTSRGKKYSYYTCNQYQNKKTCQPNMIRKEEIEEDFLNILDKVVKEKTFRDTMLNSADSANIQIKEIEDKINRKERAIEKLKLDENKLLDELIEGTDSYKETIRRKIQEKINKGEELEKDIMEDRCKIKQLQSQTLDVGEILDILEETGKIIRVLDKDAQQKLIRKLIRQIQTKDKNISEIEFTFGDVLGLSEEQGTLS
jgi:site-specific DNA recombinase